MSGADYSEKDRYKLWTKFLRLNRILLFMYTSFIHILAPERVND